MQAEPARDAKGRETGVFQFQASGANRALELLGRELGMFRDQSDHLQAGGEISKLDSNQSANLMQALMQIAFKGDADAKARAEAEVLVELGTLRSIDAAESAVRQLGRIATPIALKY